MGNQRQEKKRPEAAGAAGSRPQVSIVTPVHNAQAYVEEMIRSVQAQTLSDWELLLVDDASSDESLKRMKQAAGNDGRIRIFPRSKKEGAAAARNFGTRHAAGRYLAFLDADDKWKPEKLERELAFLQEKEAAFVCTAYEFGDETAKGTGKLVHVPAALTYKKALSRTVIFTSTVLFDRRRLPDKLLLMPNVKSEDTACWWQILRNGYTVYGLDEPLTVYRRPKRSLSSNKLEAIRRIWQLYRKQEGLSVLKSLSCFIPWAARAVWRRI